MQEKQTSPKPSAPAPMTHRHFVLVKARNKRIALIAVSLCLLLILAVAGYTAVERYLSTAKDDGLILDNVYVGGVNIGGMSKEDAEIVVRLTIESVITTQDMTVRLEYDALTISPADVGMTMDVPALIETAYRYGRNGSAAQNAATRAKAKVTDHHIALLPYLQLDLNGVYEQTKTFCAGYRNSLTQPTVTVIGDRPTYGDSDITHQTLLITMGTPQSNLTADDLYAQILDGYSLFDLSLNYAPPVVVEPKKPDALHIFEQYCLAAQDATIDSKTFAVTPEVYGYGFNVDTLQRKIDRASYGEQIEITLEFIMPDITAEALSGHLFKDTLAAYTAFCPDAYNKNRNNNLKIACQAVDGLVLKVGESFDFNQLVGRLTTAKGYASAPTYSGSNTYTIGGGITQVSSALHYCAMLAELQIDERHPHRYAMSYTPLGTDATVTYGEENLVFTNNTSAPIRILVSVSGSTVTVTFLGTKSHGYDTHIEYAALNIYQPHTTYQLMVKDNEYGYKDGDVIQTGFTGYDLQLFLCYYDPDTGLLYRREALEQLSYSSREQIVVQIGTATGNPDEDTPLAPEGGV